MLTELNGSWVDLSLVTCVDVRHLGSGSDHPPCWWVDLNNAAGVTIISGRFESEASVKEFARRVAEQVNES